MQTLAQQDSYHANCGPVALQHKKKSPVVQHKRPLGLQHTRPHNLTAARVNAQGGLDNAPRTP